VVVRAGKQDIRGGGDKRADSQDQEPAAGSWGPQLHRAAAATTLLPCGHAADIALLLPRTLWTIICCSTVKW
jgi:hypothetical protein